VLNGNDVKAEPECGRRVGPKKRAEVENANHALVWGFVSCRHALLGTAYG
jgi:hypothetical protein